jgi:hypothetical protein
MRERAMTYDQRGELGIGCVQGYGIEVTRKSGLVAKLDSQTEGKWHSPWTVEDTKNYPVDEK